MAKIQFIDSVNPPVTNTGSYVDSVTAFVMQPKYRNDHADESSRTVDAQDKALTVANLTVSNIFGDNYSVYNGVYNYSNFKTDSTRKWVKSDNPNITIEYKENTEISDPSGYRWQILNSNDTEPNSYIKNGPYTNDPWDSSELYAWRISENTMKVEVPNTNNTFATTSSYITNFLNQSQLKAKWRGSDTNRSIYETIPTGVGFVSMDVQTWKLITVSDIIYYKESPGIVGVPRNHPNFPAEPGVSYTTGVNFLGIIPGNYDITQLNNWTTGDPPGLYGNWIALYYGYVGAGPDNGVQAFKLNGGPTASEGYLSYPGSLNGHSYSDAFSIEFETELENGVIEYYYRFNIRDTVDLNDKRNINWPWDKSEPFSKARFKLPGGSENDYIKYGYRIIFMPYRSDGGSYYVYMDAFRLYHENETIVEKVVTATTNTETNLQITDN